MFNSSFVQVILYVFIIRGCRCTIGYAVCTTLEMQTVIHNDVSFSMLSTRNLNGLDHDLRDVQSIHYLREDVGTLTTTTTTSQYLKICDMETNSHHPDDGQVRVANKNTLSGCSSQRFRT